MKQIICDSCGYALKKTDKRCNIELSNFDDNYIVTLDLCEQCYDRVRKAVNLIPSDTESD